MHPLSRKNKLIAIFLVAFVCLNAGGAVCVAYCQSAMEAIAASDDHCPLKKKAAHCDPEPRERQNTTADAVGSDTLECCPMTLSFVGAPFEKWTFPFETAELAVAVKPEFNAPAVFRTSRQTSQPTHRGPPLDRRVERLKRCVIRI